MLGLLREPSQATYKEWLDGSMRATEPPLSQFQANRSKPGHRARWARALYGNGDLACGRRMKIQPAEPLPSQKRATAEPSHGGSAGEDGR